MHKANNYIIVKDRHPRISEVKNDCVNLCVPASNGESLASILQKICSKINNLPTYLIEEGDNITITGTGTEDDPWIISSFAGDANNGLSVDDGSIVLGQDVGNSDNPAILLSDREIPSDGFSISLTADEAATYTSLISKNSSANSAARTEMRVENNSDLGMNLGVGSSASTSYPSFGYIVSDTGSQGLFFFADGTGILRFGTAVEGSSGEKMRILNNGNTVVGTPFADNGAKLRVNGPLTAQRLVQVMTPNYGIQSSGEDFKVFTNEGATGTLVVDLPAAAAGRTFTFYVQDADGIQIFASGGDTIRVGASVSSAGGTLSSSTVGNSVTLVAINTVEWVAVSVIGTWTTA